MTVSRSFLRRSAHGAAFGLAMQTDVTELQRNLEVLNEIKAALGG